jgi:hypothetical protein
VICGYATWVSLVCVLAIERQFAHLTSVSAKTLVPLILRFDRG